jgi:type I restriction enzyme M protein
MLNKEATTDYWVGRQLEENNIQFDLQGSHVKEINEALKSASKRGTKKVGRPDVVAIVNDFVLVVEDKNTLSKHQKLTEKNILDDSVKAITDYAVNGACFYAKHIAKHTSFKKVFAVGVSGDPKHHQISPYWVNDRGELKKLDDIESFVWFSPGNIQEYYIRYVLEEPTRIEKTTKQILKDAAELHEYLRTYGSLKDQDKPLVVAGILLALEEIEKHNFSIESLNGDQTPESRDGDKIMNAIRARMRRSDVGPDAKRDKLLSEFGVITNSFRLNEVNETLGMTPLKYYTNFLNDRIYKNIKYQDSSADYLGQFYGKFMSYSGGDGQTLGIILTPQHICELMCQLVDIQPDDIVVDPTCGTGGFLISAMHMMISKAGTSMEKDRIKTRQLHGIELQSNMFAVAVTNMILRGDGKSNIECSDFLKMNQAQLQAEKAATVGLMNPPYSQGHSGDPNQYELSFVEHLLDSLTESGRAAVIVPQSSMTGKTKAEQEFKHSILSKHTLEGVITCNPDTFYGVGVNPVIAVFTAHKPHPAEKVCKFIDFRDDGFTVHPHVGLVADDAAKDKQQHLLDVWNGATEASSQFCVETTVNEQDEWLHSFYYFNDEIPTDADFEKAIGDYLTFEFSMIMQNREYLFEDGDNYAKS